jgi:hypothetical protein
MYPPQDYPGLVDNAFHALLTALADRGLLKKLPLYHFTERNIMAFLIKIYTEIS